jgi:hypothetical protein
MASSSTLVVPTLSHIDVSALQRRDDWSIDQWRDFTSLLADEHNGLVDMLFEARERARVSTTAYLEGTEALANLLRISNDMLHFELEALQATAKKGKRKPHKSPEAQRRLLMWSKTLRDAFTKAKPHTPTTDTAMLDWYFQKLSEEVGRRYTRAEIAAQSKTLRNLLSAARKAQATNPEKGRTSG